MKKVFSKEKYINDKTNKFKKDSWVDECDGKTIEECNKNNWLISDDWCVEVEDEI